MVVLSVLEAKSKMIHKISFSKFLESPSVAFETNV